MDVDHCISNTIKGKVLYVYMCVCMYTCMYIYIHVMYMAKPLDLRPKNFHGDHLLPKDGYRLSAIGHQALKVNITQTEVAIVRDFVKLNDG